MAFLKPARRFGFTVALATGVTCWSGTAAQPPAEEDVKAAFLYNFTRFISWPAGTTQDADAFRLCVVADTRTRAAIERAMAGESIHGRASETYVPRSPQDARRCHLLFVGRTAGAAGAQMIAAVRDLPVLTVGEGEDFIDRGGAIQFVVENQRVRFDVSPVNAERAGLTVSSRLLRVARHVKPAKGLTP